MTDQARIVIRRMLNEGLVDDPLDEGVKQWLKAIAVGGLLAFGLPGDSPDIQQPGQPSGQVAQAEPEPPEQPEPMEQPEPTEEPEQQIDFRPEERDYFDDWTDSTAAAVIRSVVKTGEKPTEDQMEYIWLNIKTLVRDRLGEMPHEDNARLTRSVWLSLNDKIKERARQESELGAITRQ